MRFVGRHEQELAEIKTLQQVLGQHLTEALERISGIQAAHSKHQAGHIRAEIDALIARYELAEGAADALVRLVGLVDWDQPNFLPKPDPIRRLQSHKGRTALMQRRAALKVLAESMSGLELEPLRAARRIADIGSGAGFPGLVLAIALPHARVTLIEKVHQQCTFLRHASVDLELGNVEVMENRVKPSKGWPARRGRFDVVVSRNVFPPQRMVALCAPLVAEGGALVLWRRRHSNSVDEELAADAAGRAGLRFDRAHRAEYRSESGVAVNYLYLYREVAESQPGSLHDWAGETTRATSGRKGAHSRAMRRAPRSAGRRRSRAAAAEGRRPKRVA